MKVKIQSVSADDIWKRLLEKPHFELAAKMYSDWESGKMLHPLAGRSRSLGRQPRESTATDGWSLDQMAPEDDWCL